MMIGALAEGYRALGDERYLRRPRRGAEFVMTRLWDGHALKRSYKDGVARFNAYLEDYALLAGALIDIYEASLDAPLPRAGAHAGRRDPRALPGSRRKAASSSPRTITSG